jgi:hypothetical protein
MPPTASTKRASYPDHGPSDRRASRRLRGAIPSEQLMRAPQKEVVGRASEVEDRGSMQDQQGWGTNLSAVVNGPARGSAQAQLTYGDGLFGRRVSLDGQLRIYAHLDNTASQPGTASGRKASTA